MTDYVSPDDFGRICAHMHHENALAVEVSLETGLRIGDVVALRRDQLNGQRIHFTASKTGKSGSKRISAQLAKQLRQIAGAVYIFEHRTDPNKHRTRQAVWRDVKSAAAACSIRQNAAPHSARKTYEVEVFHSGGLPAARKELQHNSYGTTLLYALSDKFGSVPALGAAGEETPPAFRLSESDIESIAIRVAELVLDELKRNGVFHPSHQ